MPADHNDLDSRLARCTAADRRRLHRRARRLRAEPNRQGQAERWRQFNEELRRCEALVEQRRKLLPAVRIPEQLPIAAHAEGIREALRSHPVVIVCGETGSGKSTQLPKICLLAGRGIEGQIAQTQPRRIAARSIARRLAEELGEPLGRSVGYKVRFDTRVRREASIKILTDGLLLAELGSDPGLRGYDTVIIDEAHERSLNIDFLLGYLRRLLPRRPDLKVVVSSATLDSGKFSRFFDQAPVVHIEGRTYPVEIRYQAPLEDAREPSLGIERALNSLAAEPAGDTLVFLSGEREIHEVSRHLGRACGPRLEILPLYARLSTAHQERIFAPHERPRVVLATNIAETSLTVPGIRHVVDAGYERIGRYSHGCAVQRLPVEPISKASAAQRAGRCGREAPGICVRLYSEANYQEFADHQEAEIRRTDLAAVLLRMHALGIRELRKFPFIEPPVRRHVNDGLRLLRELEALDEEDEITPRGRQLARLPVDPRVGRMLLKAGELNCVAEVLVIAAGLSVADVREHRPGQSGPLPQQLRFEDQRSDFMRLLKIWTYLHAKAPGMQAARLRSLCQRCRLSYARVQEWREVHLQLSLLAREMRLRPRNRAADYARIHRSLLAGLLRNVGQRNDRDEYTGLRGNSFRIARSSGQSRRAPGWILAAELVDTGQTLAFMGAAIRPKWVERAAGRLLRRGYFEGYWDAERGEPMIHEQTRLYSLTITARRRVRFAGISASGAREVFIRGALIDGGFDSGAAFVEANRGYIRQRREREARLRRPDESISEERLFEFYDRRLPAAVFDTHTFEHWWPRAPAEVLQDLLLERRRGLDPHGEESLLADFPRWYSTAGARLALEYSFAPGHEEDGLCVRVPGEVLGRLDPRVFEWHVPGRRQEKVIALLRILPKLMRRRLGPARAVAAEFLGQASFSSTGLYQSLSDYLALRHGVEGAVEHWRHERVMQRLPLHLLPQFEVVDSEGAGTARGRDLARLQARGAGASPQAAPAVPDAADGAARVYRHDDFPPLQDRIWARQAGSSVSMYPALVDAGAGVRVETVADPEIARARHAAGLRRLFIQRLNLDVQRQARALSRRQSLCLLYALVPEPAAALAQGLDVQPPAASAPCTELCVAVVHNAIMEAFGGGDGWGIRNQQDFEAAVAGGQTRFPEVLEEMSLLCLEILEQHRKLLGRLDDNWPAAWRDTLEDVREQARWLVWRGCFRALPAARLRQLPRYLRAASRRLDKLQRGGARDGEKLRLIRPLWERYQVRLASHLRRGRRDPALGQYRWLLEEFRVSVFAQELGTRERTSRQRLDALWQRIAP